MSKSVGKKSSTKQHAASTTVVDAPVADTTTDAATAVIAAPAAGSASASNSAGGSLVFIQTVASFLTAADKALPPGASFTPEAKKRSTKARKGAEGVISQLLALARLHGVTSVIPLDVIEESNAEAEALVPIVGQLARLEKRAGDRLFDAQATAWGTSLRLYGLLRKLSKDDAVLAAGLDPLEQFFSNRHPLVVAERVQKRKEVAAAKAQKLADALAAKAAKAGAAQEGAQSTSPPVASTAGVTNGVTHG